MNSIAPASLPLINALDELLIFKAKRLEVMVQRNHDIDNRYLALLIAGAALSLILLLAFGLTIIRTIAKLQDAKRRHRNSEEATVSARLLFEAVLEHMPAAVIVCETPGSVALWQ